MSAATISGAMDEILDKLIEVWTPRPLDTGNQDFELPKKDATWARVVIRHSGGGQITLAGNDGSSRFERAGTVIVQVFVPLNTGMKNAYTAAELAMSAFEGKATESAVWFRNVRLNEIGEDAKTGLWNQINVLADFEYDQFK